MMMESSLFASSWGLSSVAKSFWKDESLEKRQLSIMCWNAVLIKVGMLVELLPMCWKAALVNGGGSGPRAPLRSILRKPARWSE